MPTEPKKMMPIYILEILRRYTDESHTLNQQEIINYLKKDYQMTAGRKAVRRNILALMEYGYNIKYDVIPRKLSNPKPGEPEENTVLTNFYLQRDFNDCELRLLSDTLLAARYVQRGQCMDLIEKLKGLASDRFQSQVRHIASMPQTHTDNQCVFLNIEDLGQAIEEQKKVRFHYCEYGTDKKLHLKKGADGNVREYVVTPYQMAVQEGKYYLICNYDAYDDISNYRLDRIKDVEILDEPGKPFEKLQGSNGGYLDLAAYMKEHPSMYAGENVHARLRVVRAMISDMVDIFGKDIRFSDEDEQRITVSLYANERAVAQFAKSYAPDVVVLEPERLREEVKSEIERALEEYQK